MSSVIYVHKRLPPSYLKSDLVQTIQIDTKVFLDVYLTVKKFLEIFCSKNPRTSFWGWEVKSWRQGHGRCWDHWSPLPAEVIFEGVEEFLVGSLEDDRLWLVAERILIDSRRITSTILSGYMLDVLQIKVRGMGVTPVSRSENAPRVSTRGGQNT